MIAHALRRSLQSTVLTVLVAQACFAAEKTIQKQVALPAAKEFDSPSVALASLQTAHARDGDVFVLQSELDPLIDKAGGGACASAAGIDSLQALRIMAGFERLPNPHRAVLASFGDQPDLLKGRVTNEQLVKLIKFYEKYLGKVKLKVEVESAPNSRYATDARTWSKKKGPSLKVGPRKIRILSFTVSTDGKVAGRHFVLLKEESQDRNHQICVVDPTSPLKDRRYIVEHRADRDEKSARLFLLNPGDRPRNSTFELNTVFTISIESGDAVPADGSASVEYIQRKIDETAKELRGTKDYLNPRLWRRKTADFGLPRLDLPAKYGGSNWPATKMIEVFKHAGEHNLNFRDVVGGAHVRPLLNSKSKAVQHIVQQVADGKAYIAISITEPSAGSDVTAISSTARKVDGGYRLTGTKLFNARIEEATHVIIFTQGTTAFRENSASS